MAFGNTSTSDDALLKELYSDEAVQKALFVENKFFSMVPKNENAPGRHYIHPIVVGAGQSRSATFSTAQSMAGLTGEQIVDFQVGLLENHADANVQSKLIAQTSSDKGAFLKAVALIADDQLINFGNDVSVSLYRTSDGNRGQIDSTTTLASSSLKISPLKEVLNFEVGMQLDLASSKTASKRAYGSNGHGLYVTAVDYVQGILTVGTSPVAGGTACNITDAADGIPTAQTGDFIFVTGDKGLKLNGFQDWIPYGGVASNDSFLGVNRSSNPVRLAGNWLDGTGGQSLVATLEDAISQVGEVGGKLDTMMCNYKQFSQLAKELVGKTQITKVSVDGELGYESIEIIGATGPVRVIPDRSCPSTLIAGMNLDKWELLSVGKAVHVWDEDGKVWLRSPTDSGMEIRFYSFCNLLCKSPRDNINIKVNP